MKLKRLKIGPLWYRMLYDKNMKRETDNAPLMGEHSYFKNTIRIDTEAAPGVQTVVVMHEALHGMMDLIDLEKDDEESVVSRLAPVLVQFVQDNPDYIKSIMRMK